MGGMNSEPRQDTSTMPGLESNEKSSTHSGLQLHHFNSRGEQ
jgi:hypothetical protein